MSSTELFARLQESETLRDIDKGDLQEIASAAAYRDVAEGAVIFREGDPAETTFLVVNGTVSLEICTPGIGCRRISTISNGELLGWSPVLDNEHLSATARAVTPVTLIEMPKEPVLALCDHSPRFGQLFMKAIAQTLARRLTAARMQLLDVYGREEQD